MIIGVVSILRSHSVWIIRVFDCIVLDLCQKQPNEDENKVLTHTILI